MTTANTQDEEQADLVLQNQGDLFLILKNRYGEAPTSVNAFDLATLLAQRPTMTICWRPIPEPQIDDAQAFGASSEVSDEDEGVVEKELMYTTPLDRFETVHAVADEVRLQLREELEVYLGRLVAEQVAALALKADREAEIERMNFFAARAMEALICYGGALMPLDEAKREQIAHQAFEMARVMISQAKRVTKKGPPSL